MIITTCIVAAICTTRMVFEEYIERQTATLITIRQQPRMLFPTVVVCPKNPDSLNYPLVLRDISKRLPHLDRVTLGKLIGFAIAGAGFHNMNTEMGRLGDMEIKRLMALFRRWQGHRSLEEFYADLFEANGYKCANVGGGEGVGWVGGIRVARERLGQWVFKIPDFKISTSDSLAQLNSPTTPHIFSLYL